LRPGHILRLAAAALALWCAACGGSPKKEAPKSTAPPAFDAQWSQYEEKLAELQRQKNGGAPAPVPAPVPAPAPASTTTAVVAPAPAPAPLICPSTAPIRDFPGRDAEIQAAKDAIYAGKYPDAVDHLAQVLSKDSGSAQALEILGSAFYMEGVLDKAKAVWQRAYAIDPCRKEIPAFIDSIDKKTR
jgi:tetratricopeptide (TPR) repeat protein